MNTKHTLCAAVAALGLAFLAGCATDNGPSAPQDTTKYTLENTEKFVLLDKPTQSAVSCTGLKERVLPNGHMEVVANVKNREAAALALQVSCVFKDEQGFAIGEESPLQNLALPGHATETVRFTAPNSQAKSYTIRVRQGK